MTVNAPAGAPPSLGTDPGDPSRAEVVGGVGQQLSGEEALGDDALGAVRGDHGDHLERPARHDVEDAQSDLAVGRDLCPGPHL